MDLRNGIDNCTEELAKLFGTLYDSIVNASPITQFHRKEMMLLYEILGKLSDDHDDEKGGRKVYERGFELDYHNYPLIEGRVPYAICIEVLDILGMMESLQDAWREFSEQDKARIRTEVGEKVEYLVNNVGFWVNEEGDHFSYMKFINEQGGFTHLNYAFNNGNSHMNNLPRYRKMQREYRNIKHDDGNDFFRERRVLSLDEVIQILSAQYGAQSHPL